MDRSDREREPLFGAALLGAMRAVLGWSLVEAGRCAGVSVATVLAAEGKGGRRPSGAGVEALRRAYEEAGVRPFDEGAAGYGIRVTAVSPARPDMN